MTSLWRNVSVNAVANSNRSCLFSAPKVHWKVQPTAARERQIQQNAWGLWALYVSLNNASITVRKCLKRNNGHLITLQIWMEWRYRVWRPTHEIFWTFIWSPKQFLNKKSRTGEDMGQFFAGTINKAIQSFTSSLTRVRERWLKTF